MPLTHAAPSIPNSYYNASDYGLLAYNWDPACALNNLTSMNTAARLHIFRLELPQAIRVTNVHFYVNTVGASLTSGSCGVAVYNNSQGLIGSSTTGVHTAMQTLGFATIPLTSGPFAVPAGFCHVALWWNGTTAPQLLRGVGVTDINLQKIAFEARLGFANASITTAAPATLSNFTLVSNIPFWVGLS